MSCAAGKMSVHAPDVPSWTAPLEQPTDEEQPPVPPPCFEPHLPEYINSIIGCDNLFPCCQPEHPASFWEEGYQTSLGAASVVTTVPQYPSFTGHALPHYDERQVAGLGPDVPVQEMRQGGAINLTPVRWSDRRRSHPVFYGTEVSKTPKKRGRKPRKPGLSSVTKTSSTAITSGKSSPNAVAWELEVSPPLISARPRPTMFSITLLSYLLKGKKQKKAKFPDISRAA